MDDSPTAANCLGGPLFFDDARFVLDAFPGILWSFSRLFVKTSAGRKRFNMLGALNTITYEMVMVTNDTYIVPEQKQSFLISDSGL